MNESQKSTSSIQHHRVIRESVPAGTAFLPGPAGQGADQLPPVIAAAALRRNRMPMLVLAGLTAASSILVAVLTHAVTNPQAYI